MNDHFDSNLFVIWLAFFVFRRVKSSFAKVCQRDGTRPTKRSFIGCSFHTVRLHRIARCRVILVFRVAQAEIRWMFRFVQIRFAVGRQHNGLLTYNRLIIVSPIFSYFKNHDYDVTLMIWSSAYFHN